MAAVAETEARCAALEVAHQERIRAHENSVAEGAERETELILEQEQVRKELLGLKSAELARGLEVEKYRSELSVAVAEHEATVSEHEQKYDSASTMLKAAQERADAALTEVNLHQQQARVLGEEVTSERQAAATQAAVALLDQTAGADAKADVNTRAKQDMDALQEHLEQVEAERDLLEAEVEALRQAEKASVTSGMLDLHTASPPVAPSTSLPPQYFSSIDSYADHRISPSQSTQDLADLASTPEHPAGLDPTSLDQQLQQQLALLMQDVADTKTAMEVHFYARFMLCYTSMFY